MSEILQPQALDDKLYEYNFEKPELSDRRLEHLGIKEDVVKTLNDYIMHYNHNHDPRNGQFSSGPGGGSGRSGSITKKKSRHQLRVEARKKKKLNKQRAESLRKAREAKSAKKIETQKTEDIKKKALDTGDIRLARENSDKFTTEELQKVLDRYDKNQKLSNLINQENEAKKIDFYEKAMKIQKYADVTAKTVQSLGTIYDVYNKYNRTKQEQSSRLAESNRRAVKNKILSTRNLQEAYKNRHLFTKDELTNLMATADVDKQLKSRIAKEATEKNAVTKRLSELRASKSADNISKQYDKQQKADNKAAAKAMSKAEKQIQKYEDAYAKRNSKAGSNFKFKNEDEYRQAKSSASFQLNANKKPNEALETPTSQQIMDMAQRQRNLNKAAKANYLRSKFGLRKR